jgi:hypothetical protein
MHEQAEIPDAAGDSEHIGLNIARAMAVRVCADVLRPSLSWLLTPAPVLCSATSRVTLRWEHPASSLRRGWSR